MKTLLLLLALLPLSASAQLQWRLSIKLIADANGNPPPNAAQNLTNEVLVANQLLTNRTGHPIISLPNGFFEGSPTALQMTGKLFGEPELLLLAHAFQARTDHHLKHPSLA